MKYYNRKIPTKVTKKLFLDKYQYKIVLVCPVASWFRGGNLAFAGTKLSLIDKNELPLASPLWSKLRTPADLKFCLDLLGTLHKMQNYDIRVEHPIINFYTNDSKDIKLLSNIDRDRVKYISMPDTNNPLTPNCVYLPKIDYGFKVTMGRTRNSYDNFITWAQKTNKVRLTKKTIEELSRGHSWGGSYFYVKDEHCLTLVKMFLGSEISRIDTVIHDSVTN
jgi:hypothetical protein